MKEIKLYDFVSAKLHHGTVVKIYKNGKAFDIELASGNTIKAERKDIQVLDKNDPNYFEGM